MTKRIALYWHNGRSLGHTVRSFALGQAMLTYIPESTVVGITGASRYYELLPAGMDVLKIPSFMGYDAEGAVRNESILAVTKKEFQTMRENLITSFIRDFRPDALIVDYNPQGKNGELVPALVNSPATKKVLGLRGILGSFAETNAEFFSPRMVAFIQEQFSAIHVYTDPRVFCLEDYYKTPPAINAMLHYTGYVTRPTVATKAEARAQLHIDADARIIVANFGGGQGTEMIWQSTLHALTNLRKQYDVAYLAAGPYLEADAYARICEQVEAHPEWKWTRLLNPLQTWMKASDLFIGAGGYNTLAEIITTGANALIVPRQLSEQEQLMHAQRLTEMKVLRIISLDTILYEDVTTVFEQCLKEPYPDTTGETLATDGAYQHARLVETLL
ncbi:MAG: glycosyltransferase family protein [Ktedonobacteraceae bacterium]